MYKSYYKQCLKKALFLLAMTGASTMRPQSPPDYIIENKTFSSGNHSFCSDGYITSPSSPAFPVNYSGTARVDYSASRYIDLLPGFKAGSMASGGKFETHFYTPQFPVTVIAPSTPGQVGLYEKLEYSLDLPTVIDNLVSNYFATTLPLVNPFDPDDIDITATFTSPSGTQNRTIHGFYYKSFSYNAAATRWINPISDFRVRFAPTELGTWNCSINVSSPNNKFTGTYNVSCLNFMCIPSSNKGYLEVGQDGRHLRFSGTHESFFAVGQNIPWIDHSDLWNTDLFIPKAFMSFTSMAADIGTNQGNYIRFLMAPWSHGIEWEKPGDYSTYTTTVGGTTVTMDRQQNAFELDNAFDACHQSGVYVHLNLEMQTSYNASFGETLYAWPNNPYHGFSGISVPTDVLSNADAKKYFKRRLRYIIARWGYSTNLAVIELLSEQDGWDGFGILAGTTANSYSWHQEMAQYIKTTLGDENHLLSTCYANRPAGSPMPPVNNFNIPEIDVTSSHKYASDREMNLQERWQQLNEPYVPYASPSQGLFVDIPKPTIFGELGIQEIPPMDVVTQEGCNDVNWHNNMWSSAFMGSFGAGLNWWQEWNPIFRSNNFPALSSFFGSVDFEAENFTLPYKWKDIHIPSHDHRYEMFALRNPSGMKMIGWAHNSTYWWGNMSTGCPDHEGDYADPSSCHDDSYSAQTNFPSVKVQIGGLLPPAYSYAIDWFNTRGSGGSYSSETKCSDIFGRLKCYMPGPDGDYAFKAHGTGLCIPIPHLREEELLPDTLECGEDTILVNATLPEDTTDAYSYYWNFGNGQTSSSAQTTAVFSNPGTYTVSLIITDPSDHNDTLRQIIVVPDCNGQNRFKQSITYESQVNGIRIYPNPNNGLFTLTIEGDEVKHVTIYNTVGKIVYDKSISGNYANIDIKNESKGIYFVKVVNGNTIETKKIVNQ